MIWWARAIYRFLLWREQRLARQEEPLQRSGNSAPRKGEAWREPSHLLRGRRGELLAYWYLRQAGYTIVARNRRPGVGRGRQPGPIPGELDLVAWDGPVLAFVEVKTRASLERQPDARLVHAAQRRRIVRAAVGYVRRLKRPGKINYRFDVVAVAWDPAAGYSVKLVKDAFRAPRPQETK